MCAVRPVAALSMYDMPALRSWNDRVIRSIGQELDMPNLRNARDLATASLWRHPRLLLAQTCIEPFRHGAARGLTLIGFPIYEGIPGCDGPTYRSLILRRRGDHPASPRYAVNGRDSQSGWVALLQSFETLGLADPRKSRVVISGAHAASISMLTRGQADFAAVDCVTLHYLMQDDPTLMAMLDIIGEGPPAPSLPLITRAGRPLRPVEEIRQAVRKHFGAVATTLPDI